MIRVKLEKEEVLNGEPLRGQAEWTSEGKEPRKIEVTCRWRIEGKGRRAEELVDLEIEANMAARQQITIPFEFVIPVLGPLTYDGKLFRVVWEIVANADMPFALDERDIKSFIVRPRRYDAEEFARMRDEEEKEEPEPTA